MLTEERLEKITSLVNASGSVTIDYLVKELDTSESTIRRDLAVLHDEGRLKKVRGGAIAAKNAYGTQDDRVSFRKEQHIAEKIMIGQKAAERITDSDFVFIDAGTTTERMIPYIKSREAVFVTNALSHAMKLSEMDLTVYILGGAFKNTTEAIVGEEAISSLRKYNFTKGFFGTNGVTVDAGFTTPEVRESMLKRYSKISVFYEGGEFYDLYPAEKEKAFGRVISSGTTFVRQGKKIGRNDPCPCGSGKKYKNCCMR